ncbi:MAG: GNAT family N-acetyltransferase [Bacteroidetes bacterium]|nr:GNAT family N-acetyltransferase [Bacteroidota bacterium]MBU1372286.1 GNAT family N-acetyltransferase [Bacteroidota bacterium]MBU1486049.1 GNAT family N-acetyltransferase [Bacteroidota bacterium]MBU1759481.1 GNAT family N-acetyltransferase [Bacteroidota bacterium]MBU2046900.1 GNAT family N-acetyltransferase [Bacteroidota bacterium]
MSIQIKACQLTDQLLLSQVANKAYNDHYLYLWDDGGEFYVQANFTPPQFEKELSDSNALFYLIYKDEEAVGYLKLNIHKAFQDFTDQQALELERIYLMKSVTGQGVGSHVMNFVIALAREKQKSIIWLKSMDSSASVSFYQQHGFEVVGENLLPYALMKKEFRRILSLYRKV